MDSNDATVDDSKVWVVVDYSIIGKLPGYTVIESKSDHNLGGNGLLIALKNNSGLQIFELKQHPHWTSAKIIGKTTDGNKFTLIIINLHLPSAGIRKKDAILTLNRHVHKITENKPHQKLMILGDYNMDTAQMEQKYNTNIEQGTTRTIIEAKNVRDDRLRISYWIKTHKMKVLDYRTTNKVANNTKVVKKKISRSNANISETIKNILLGCMC
ncbi:hypothetical protein BB561_002345 [Smittium simulii]|uniref:Endonuclease/exonuclease/phosphatase domain-containing protein n=1 Tax=Smittium simulii TaxID=133385 RepID=A0A2T9YQQ4_9FUNG|nr:hypothetical protein BB561_002345 [Smittium simulii]